jgi:hypothetical protein
MRAARPEPPARSNPVPSPCHDRQVQVRPHAWALSCPSAGRNRGELLPDPSHAACAAPRTLECVAVVCASPAWRPKQAPGQEEQQCAQWTHWSVIQPVKTWYDSYRSLVETGKTGCGLPPRPAQPFRRARPQPSIPALRKRALSQVVRSHGPQQGRGILDDNTRTRLRTRAKASYHGHPHDQTDRARLTAWRTSRHDDHGSPVTDHA